MQIVGLNLEVSNKDYCMWLQYSSVWQRNKSSSTVCLYAQVLPGDITVTPVTQFHYIFSPKIILRIPGESFVFLKIIIYIHSCFMIRKFPAFTFCCTKTTLKKAIIKFKVYSSCLQEERFTKTTHISGIVCCCSFDNSLSSCGHPITNIVSKWLPLLARFSAHNTLLGAFQLYPALQLSKRAL